MKQRITKEQFYELSERGKEKISEWLEKKQYGAEIDGVFVAAMQVTIGEMMEFLVDNDYYFIGSLLEQNQPSLWCDSLWEVAKEILERQN